MKSLVAQIKEDRGLMLYLPDVDELVRSLPRNFLLGVLYHMRKHWMDAIKNDAIGARAVRRAFAREQLPL